MALKNVTPPIEMDRTYEMTAERLNDDGDGVGKIEDFTVFVPFLLPGERGQVRITDIQKRFARAELEERHTTSEYRQDAPCPVFGACGGCQVQHLDYVSQLEWKADRIKRVAFNLGLDVDSVVKDMIPSEKPWRYRNQVQIPVAFGEESGTVDMGFFGLQSHDIVPTDSCHLQTEAMQVTFDKARKFLTSLGEDKASKVHHLILRASATTGDQVVVFTVSEEDEELAQSLRRFHAPQVATVALTVQPRVGGPVWGKQVTVLKGADMLEDSIGGLQFQSSPRSFQQVNAEVANHLYTTVLDFAQLTEKEVVLDAYCGIGTLTLLLAAKAKRVVGVEDVEASVEDARLNAERNGVGNIKFQKGRVERWLPHFVASGGKIDVAVFDPPRKGIDAPAIDSVVKAKPRRIIYASCNPATLQRDLQRFIAAGYRVEAMQPLDMFPQTSHVEVISSLVLDKSEGHEL